MNSDKVRDTRNEVRFNTSTLHGCGPLRPPKLCEGGWTVDRFARRSFAKAGGLLIARIILLLFLPACVHAQDTIRYTGRTLSNVDYHHGQLSPVKGVHNIQVMRANREHPEKGDGFGWTYNHAPMLAYWNNTFYLQYLSNPVGEHVPPGQTLLSTSKDGYVWSKPVILFPTYKIPDGTTKEGYPGVAKDLYAVMHQRMGFYVSRKHDRLLTVAYYGIALDAKDDPNDGKGIGRVVREIYKDGTFGPIYFIRFNSRWNDQNAAYPIYKKSKDKGFVQACDALLGDPLMMQQWVEEADRDDPLIPLKKQYKALSYYHLPNGNVVGLWKHALTSVSTNEGKSWQYDPVRAPGFVNSNAKIWGQRTSDGKYATVYNPSEFRWPLALSVSDNGLAYKNLLLVHGEITPMRYGGNYKSYGPQYVRGILEGNGTPPDGKLWVAYSVNKEDLWISRIPVPIEDTEAKAVNEIFDSLDPLKHWNIYSPLWAQAAITSTPDGKQSLLLQDADPFDYAKAERLFPAAQKTEIEFSITAAQADKGMLQIELQDAKGTPAARLTFDSDGVFRTKAGARFKNMMQYRAGERYDVRVGFNTTTRMYTVNVNGKNVGTFLFFAPVDVLQRIVFRTGEPRTFPTPETPADQTYDLKDAGESDPKAAFYIHALKTY